MKTNFKLPVKTDIKQFPSGEVYTIHSLDDGFEVSDKEIDKIARICSEDLIYSVLFREKFSGKPYTEKSAYEFVKWAKEGWDKNKWFVFLITDQEGEIVGAVDIKSDNLENSEIGYWMTENVKGVMTNAVISLCGIAKDAGYKSLYALTVPDNFKSQNVLVRSGFENKGPVVEKGKEYISFQKIFNSC